MKTSDLPPEILNGAYKIFVEEVRRHLSETRIAFYDGELPSPDLKATTGRFHQIRGGAGFFGLDEIENTAREIEKILKSLSDSEGEEVTTLRALYLKLEEHVSNISKPRA